MDMFYLMRVFTVVAESGSFSAAAQRLKCSPVMVGKYISSLEIHLNAKLIARTTRQQRLTYAGMTFLESSKALLRQVRRAEDEVASVANAEVGTIRISAPPVLGGLVLAPYIAHFSKQHRGLNIELALSNQFVELIEDNFDLVIRTGEIRPNSCIAREVGHYQMMTVASPDYVSRSGTPRLPAELSSHYCIGQRSSFGLIEWSLGAAAYEWPKACAMTSTDSYAILHLALNGAGVAVLPEILVREYVATRSLIEILPTFKPLPKPVSVLYLEEKFSRRSLATFTESLVCELREALRQG